MRLRILVVLGLLLFTPTSRGSVITGDSFGTGSNTFNIDFVTIGNPGNANDSVVISTNIDGTPNKIIQVGSVSYIFKIGMFEVSRDAVIKANNVGNLGITLFDMSSLGGNGVNRPATGVSWNEAARFVNWLNTSTGNQPAYKFELQPGQLGYDPNTNIGLWTPLDVGYDSNNLYRNRLAQYFMANEHEWYKAAYYDPANPVYYDQPTGSDADPISVASGIATGTAVYDRTPSAGPADVNLAGGPSPYGTVGQGGNVHEWVETSDDLLNNSITKARVYRGGDWDDSAIRLSGRGRSSNNPTIPSDRIGFRVVSAVVPEPSAFLLFCFGACAFLFRLRNGC